MAIYIKGVDNINVGQTIAVTKLIDGTFLYTEVSDKGRMTIYTKDVYIIPEPHGRLIDGDELSKKLCETTIFIKDGEVFQRMIKDAPTVIEGSE